MKTSDSEQIGATRLHRATVGSTVRACLRWVALIGLFGALLSALTYTSNEYGAFPTIKEGGVYWCSLSDRTTDIKACMHCPQDVGEPSHQSGSRCMPETNDPLWVAVLHAGVITGSAFYLWLLLRVFTRIAPMQPGPRSERARISLRINTRVFFLCTLLIAIVSRFADYGLTAIDPHVHAQWYWFEHRAITLWFDPFFHPEALPQGLGWVVALSLVFAAFWTFVIPSLYLGRLPRWPTLARAIAYCGGLAIIVSVSMKLTHAYAMYHPIDAITECMAQGGRYIPFIPDCSSVINLAENRETYRTRYAIYVQRHLALSPLVLVYCHAIGALFARHLIRRSVAYAARNGTDGD